MLTNSATSSPYRVIRAGYSWGASDRYRLDDTRPGDAAVVGELLKSTRRGVLWDGASRFFEEFRYRPAPSEVNS